MNSKFDPIGTNEIGSADNVQQKRKAGIFFRFDEKRWEILTFKTYYHDDSDGSDNRMKEEGYKWHDEKKCWYFGPDDSDFDLLGPPAQLEFMRLNRFGWDPVNEFWYHWDTRLLEFIVRFHGKYPSWYWSGKKELTFDEAEDVVLLDELNILFGRRMRRKKQEGNRVTYTGLWYSNECAELMRWFIKYINYLESLMPPCDHEALKKYCGGEVRIGQKIFYTQARKEGTVLSAFFREALGKKIPHIVLRVNGKYMSYSGTDYCSVTMSGSKRREVDVCDAFEDKLRQIFPRGCIVSRRDKEDLEESRFAAILKRREHVLLFVWHEYDVCDDLYDDFRGEFKGEAQKLFAEYKNIVQWERLGGGAVIVSIKEASKQPLKKRKVTVTNAVTETTKEDKSAMKKSVNCDDLSNEYPLVDTQENARFEKEIQVQEEVKAAYQKEGAASKLERELLNTKELLKNYEQQVQQMPKECLQEIKKSIQNLKKQLKRQIAKNEEK